MTLSIDFRLRSAALLKVGLANDVHEPEHETRLSERLANPHPVLVKLRETLGLVLDVEPGRGTDETAHMLVRLAKPECDARTLSEHIAQRSLYGEGVRVVDFERDVARGDLDCSHCTSSCDARSAGTAGVYITVEGSPDVSGAKLRQAVQVALLAEHGLPSGGNA